MDIIPRFYIFGVPDGFDILDGTSAEITYFQKFYNGSTENTKFSIHRDVKGNITYAYLKYNLSSGKSRTGSFFGMSLIFNNVYCANPLRLYELFDWVYNSYIVIDEEKEKQGNEIGFIRAINNNKDIQARYDITRFQDKREYIQHYIESVLLGNINKEFKDVFYVIDSSFSNEHPNLVVQEPLVVQEKPEEFISNEKLLADLRQYNRVSVSPDWHLPIDSDGDKGTISTTPANNATIVLAPEYVVSLLEYTTGYQKYIIDSLNDIDSADIDEANNIYEEVVTRLKEVKSTPSSDKRVSQIITDYSTLTEQLSILIKKITDSQTLPSTLPPPIPWWKNPKILALGGVVAFVVILLAILICKPSGNIAPYRPEQPRIAKEVRELISKQFFKEAYEKADSLNDVNLRKRLKDSAMCSLVDESINYENPDEDAYNKITYAYNEVAPKINNDDSRKANLEKLISAWEGCVDGIITGIEKTKNKESAGQWKKIINEKGSIGKNSGKFNTFVSRLDAVNNKSQLTPSTPPNLTETTNFKIEIWETARRGDMDDDPNRSGRMDVDKNKTISGRYFYYRFCANGIPCSYDTADKHIKAGNDKLAVKNGNGWYHIEEGIGAIKIVDNGQTLFTITIGSQD